MEILNISDADSRKLYKLVFAMSIFTILYNIAEGIISVYIGYEEESLTLFGFGVDSFIEVISGIGIANMVIRIQRQPDSNRNDFERRALRITGFAFYGLVAGLLLSSGYNLIIGHHPEQTIGGVIISLISILTMWIMIHYKTSYGKKLQSDAIIADAECARVCMYMSIVLLLSSAIYYFAHLSYIDSLGTFVLSYFSFKEGKECFEKAASNKHCSCDH